MAERGRTAGFQMGAEHRLKITNSNILSNLIKAANGEIELTPTRVTISLALLKKVMPDLSQVQLTGDEDAPLNVIHKIERVIVDVKD